MVDAFGHHTEMVAYRDGCQEVLDVVGPDEMGVYDIPIGVTAEEIVLQSPSERKEWGTSDDLTLDADVGVGT